MNCIDKIKSTIESTIKRWCNFKHNKRDYADEVIEQITSELGQYKEFVRAMTAIWKYGVRGSRSGNFDIDMRCADFFFE